MERSQILKIRISVLFIREKFTFFNSVIEFKNRLRQLFVEDYTLDEIETCLNELEDQLVEEPEKVFEYPEDY